MREIKFRSWDNVNNQMLREGGQYGLDIAVSKHISEDCWTRFWEAKFRCLENFSLMQFTGLKDKNGKEIYEGDVVKVKNTPVIDCGKYEIVWKGAGFWFKDSELGSGELYVFDQTAYILEVIGNIYENPDLLK